MGVSSIKEFALTADGGYRMRSLFFRMYHRSTLVSDDHQNRQTTDGKTDRKTEKIKQKSDQARVLLPAAPLWHMHNIV